MRYAMGIYRRLISIQIRSQMQYPVSFWMELATTGLLNGVYFLTLALVLERFGQVAGWKLGEIAFLAGMVEMSFATMDMIFAGFDPAWFAPLIRLGTLDQFLLRPVGLTLQLFGLRLEMRRIGRIFEGAVIFGIALALNPVPWTLGRVLYLPVVLVSQVVCFGSLFMMGSTLTFWTLQPIEAVNIVTYGGNEMMSYPMQIYPAWLRGFFTFIIPFIFLNYYPALYLLDKPDPLHFPTFAPFLAPLAAIIMLGMASAFWRVGVRHYQGAGS